MSTANKNLNATQPRLIMVTVTENLKEHIFMFSAASWWCVMSEYALKWKRTLLWTWMARLSLVSMKYSLQKIETRQPSLSPVFSLRDMIKLLHWWLIKDHFCVHSLISKIKSLQWSPNCYRRYQIQARMSPLMVPQVTVPVFSFLSLGCSCYWMLESFLNIRREKVKCK